MNNAAQDIEGLAWAEPLVDGGFIDLDALPTLKEGFLQLYAWSNFFQLHRWSQSFQNTLESTNPSYPELI